MSSQLILPHNIEKLISGQVPEANNVGYSGASVYVLDDMVLKIEKISENNDATVEVMKWLSQSCFTLTSNKRRPAFKNACHLFKVRG